MKLIPTLYTAASTLALAVCAASGYVLMTEEQEAPPRAASEEAPGLPVVLATEEALPRGPGAPTLAWAGTDPGGLEIRAGLGR